MPSSEKCVLFNKIELPSDKDINNVIVSLLIYDNYYYTYDNYYYCSTAREFNTMCGEDARYYIPKIEEKNE
jgi:hypothetical protein